MATVSKTQSSFVNSFDTDPNIQKLMTAASDTDKKITSELSRLNNKATSEEDKSAIMFNVQRLQNLQERFYSLISALIESSHRTMMSIINKIGS